MALDHAAGFHGYQTVLTEQKGRLIVSKSSLKETIAAPGYVAGALYHDDSEWRWANSSSPSIAGTLSFVAERHEQLDEKTELAVDTGTVVKSSDVFVIVPVYNEAAVLREVLSGLVASGYTVVPVDDGSSDDSWNVICELPVHGLRHELNLGQGAALETGMEYARRQGAVIAVHFDADGQHAAEQIDSLIEPLHRGEADVVLGSRFLRAADTARIPPGRRMLLRIGRIVTGVLNGVWLNDTHNGFRALSRRALSRIRLSERGYGHASEILDKIRAHGLRYVEVPVTISYSDYSLAKGQRSLDAFNVLLDVLLNKLFR